MCRKLTLEELVRANSVMDTNQSKKNSLLCYTMLYASYMFRNPAFHHSANYHISQVRKISL